MNSTTACASGANCLATMRQGASKSIISTFLVLSFIVSLTNGLIIETTLGKVRGISSISRDGNVFYEWLGIPYAEPPVGRLRFESPVPKKPWRGVRDANEYGSYCPQLNLFFEFYQGEEDCLYLNVHVPKDAIDSDYGDPLPVMFFIHGGYFSGGEGLDLRPDYFIDHNIIIVTVNYRLSVLGFLNTGDKAARGNMGLKDQTLALKWVYESIEYFGGDPKRITVFGVSSGAASAHLLLISPLSRNYVHKAISQSGTAFAHWSIFEDPVKQSQDFAKKLGCPTSNTTELVECLRGFPAKAIFSVFKGKSFLFAGSGWSKADVFVPTIETVVDSNTFLAEDPKDMVKRGDFKPVPWLTGSNSGEGLINLSRYASNRTFRNRVRYEWEQASHEFLYLSNEERSHAFKIREFYLGNIAEVNLHSKSTFQKLVNMASDRNFNVPLHTAAKLHAKLAPVYTYHYDKPIFPSLFDFTRAIRGKRPKSLEVVQEFARRTLQRLISRGPATTYGACHGDEFFMQTPVLSILNAAGRLSRNYEFSKQFTGLWAQWVSTRRPTLMFQGKLFLPLNLRNEFKYFIIADEPKSGMKTVPFAARFSFWKSINKET